MKVLITAFILAVGTNVLINSEYVSFGARGTITCNGNPYKNAEVILFNIHNRNVQHCGNTTTDNNGKFSIEHTEQTDNPASVHPWLYIYYKCNLPQQDWLTIEMKKESLSHSQSPEKYEEHNIELSEHENEQ